LHGVILRVGVSSGYRADSRSEAPPDGRVMSRQRLFHCSALLDFLHGHVAAVSAPVFRRHRRRRLPPAKAEALVVHALAHIGQIRFATTCAYFSVVTAGRIKAPAVAAGILPDGTVPLATMAAVIRSREISFRNEQKQDKAATWRK
jgi:hypothetical protein